MNRYIAIYPSRCVACGTCRAACSEGHRRAGLSKEPRLALFESRDLVASVTCHHCEGAPCLKVCPINAIRRDPDGCIRVDEAHCIGCKLCAVSCPFGAIHMAGTPRAGVAGIEYNTPTFPGSLDPILQCEVGVSPIAVKCDLCAYDNCKPHCVDACITEALVLMECDEDGNEIVRRRSNSVQEGLEAFQNMDEEGGN